MKCIDIINDANLINNLNLVDAPVPLMGAGHVLIRVRFSGVNRPDILQRKGLYPHPEGASPILGLEVSGVIEALGEGVTRWEIGQEVCALVNGGGYAQFVCVDARHLLPIPKGMSLQDAASLPEGVMTVYANLCEHGAFQAGETVLVHGANSGIGAMTIMMAKALGGRVIATARGADKCAYGTALGADHVIDTSDCDFAPAVKAFGGADVILDILGGEVTAKNIACLKFKGRLVQVGTQMGAKAQIELGQIMRKQAVLTGSMLRPRSADEKARLTQSVRDVVWPLIESGKIKALVERVFDLKDAKSAHDFLDSGAHKGKVVLRV